MEMREGTAEPLPDHGDAAVARQLGVVQHAAQECVEALREDPRALALQ